MIGSGLCFATGEVSSSDPCLVSYQNNNSTSEGCPGQFSLPLREIDRALIFALRSGMRFKA